MLFFVNIHIAFVVEAAKMVSVSRAIIASVERVTNMMWTLPVACPIVVTVAVMVFALDLGCANVSRAMSIENPVVNPYARRKYSVS